MRAAEPLHCTAVWLHLGLWMWRQDRRQQLTTRTPTPSWPHDILQKCNLSSATDICKQLMTFRRTTTRVKILAFLIYPNEWRFILVGEKSYWEVNKQTRTQRPYRETWTNQTFGQSPTKWSLTRASADSALGMGHRREFRAIIWVGENLNTKGETGDSAKVCSIEKVKLVYTLVR